MGEVSLKVIRSHTLSILSLSLEISRKKIQQQARGCFLALQDTRSVHYDLVQSREGAEGERHPRNSIM